MRKFFLAAIIVVALLIAGVLAYLWMTSPAPMVNAPAPMANANQPASSFDTNDNLNDALSDVNAVE